ncbi:hypothetical protein N7454_010243 [Penicillium verhagenii]|nr:hypothetical protein N7454_010243 [Penicillium verhagenii]
MKVTILLLFCLSATAWAEPEKRDTTSTTSGFDFASFTNIIIDLAAATQTGNFANISPAPRSFLQEILAVVPMTVVGELMDATSRSSLASELNAGTTPIWYSSLPVEAKSYISVVRLQVQDGAVTATTGLAYETTAASGSSGTAATGTGTATATAAASTSKSSGMAAQPTVMTAMAGAAMGILGLALAL